MEERVPLVMDPGAHNADYLAAKREKLGHLFESESPCVVLALAVNVGPEAGPRFAGSGGHRPAPWLQP